MTPFTPKKVRKQPSEREQAERHAGTMAFFDTAKRLADEIEEAEKAREQGDESGSH